MTKMISFYYKGHSSDTKWKLKMIQKSEGMTLLKKFKWNSAAHCFLLTFCLTYAYIFLEEKIKEIGKKNMNVNMKMYDMKLMQYKAMVI